jgi:uncharacterized protein (TIGR03435 family)
MVRTAFAAAILCGVWFLPASEQRGFDVASVKPTPSSRQYQLAFEKCRGGGRFLATGMPVLSIVEFAYHVQEDQIIGAPPWLRSFSDAYDMEGKSEGQVDEQGCRLRVQALLEDRFRIAVHRESREGAVFDLVTEKNPPKIRAVTPESPAGGVKVNGRVEQALSEQEAPAGWTMPQLANYLANFTGRPVVDRTGLSGMYAFTLEFAHSAQEEESRPSVFSAVQEQLGLRLKPAKAAVDVLVIDRIERPSAN